MEFLIVLIILALALFFVIRHGIRSMRRDESPCCGCSTCSLPEEMRQLCATEREFPPSQPTSDNRTGQLQGDRS